MKNLIWLSIIFVAICMISCGESKKNDTQKTDSVPKKTEIITRTFSTKHENGNMIKDTVNMIQSYIVDEKGKELSNIYYNLDNSESWRDEYKYDENGNKIGSNYFEGSKQVSYYEYDIDDLGRRIGYRAKDINTDTLLYDGASKYEDNGKLRKDGYINKRGEFKWNYEYLFDESGKELGFVYVSSKSGKRFPKNYEYIKFNDDKEWVERKIVENDTVVSIETRAFKIIE